MGNLIMFNLSNSYKFKKYPEKINDFIDKYRSKVSTNPRYLELFDSYLDMFGVYGIIGASSGNERVVYPNLLLPNGTLTQTFSSSGNAVTTFYIGGRPLASTDFSLGMQLSSTGTANAPFVYICIFQESTGVNLGNGPNFNPYHGIVIQINAGLGSGPVIQGITGHNGTSSTTISGSYGVHNYVYASVTDSKFTFAYDLAATVAFGNYDISSFFTNNDRYLHVYRLDAGASGSSLTITNISSPI